MNFLKKKTKQKEIIEAEFDDINLLSPKIFPREEAIEKYSFYFKKLRSAINSKSAKNIAITGAYGSGKTSLIQNFQNVYSERKYLNISLATFKEEIEHEKTKIENRQDPIITNLDEQIELSILQQILYHVEPSKIPNSNLKRIKSISSQNSILLVFGILVWILSVVVLFSFKNFHKLNPYLWKLELPFDWLIFFTSLFFFSGVSYLTYTLIKILNNININKLKIFDSELELGKDINKSILNEHIDEIIYFFQRTEFDVIIFEDIDRFKNTEIFTKLREINLLLNKSKLVKREELKKIVFIYAIRDDKFKDNERTKFFDYIIPIIPFINPDNANTQLWKLIKSEKLENAFSKSFINDITKLIDEIDMRLLINIFNEFIIYKSQLLNDDFNQDVNNNLLSIIIYKNLHPNDFSLLSQRNGKLYTLLNKKNVYTKDLINNIDEKIFKLETKIEVLEKEKIKNIDELRAIYINALNRDYNNLIAVYIKNKYYSISSLNTDDNFDELKELTTLNYYYFDNYQSLRNSNQTFSFNSFQNKVDTNLSYDKRLENIKTGVGSKINNYKLQIENLKKQKSNTENWDLSKILQETEIELDFGNLKNTQLLNFLVINGYINENYKHYTSLFHEENLTKEDYDFEIKVKTNQRSNFDYELLNIENLVNEIESKYFERPSILNYQILNYLIDNKFTEKVKLSRFLTQLSQNRTLYLDFIDSYIEHEEVENKKSNNVSFFFSLLCEKWHNIWNFIEYESHFSIEKTDQYLKYIIQYANLNDIKKIHDNSNFKKYIEENTKFINLFDYDFVFETSNVLKELNIELNNLSIINDKNKELYDFIYENNHYQINSKNLKRIISTYHIDENIRTNSKKINDDFDKTNYQFILDSKCENLINYINDFFEYYTDEVYLVTSVNNESEEILIKHFINNNEIKESLRRDIIYKTSTVFEDITTIQDNYHKQIAFEVSKIKPTWTNIYEYLLHIDSENTTYINDTLIKFYNKKGNYQALSESNMRPENIKENLEEFYDGVESALLECSSLSDEAYQALISSSHYNYNSLEFANLNPEKVKMLLNIKKLMLTISNYDLLRDNFPKYHITLIELHQEKFTQKTEDYSLNNYDYFDLLNSSKFKSDNKLNLIPVIDKTFLVDKKLANKIIDLVLETNYNDLSFEFLKAIIDNNINMEKVIKLVNLYIKEIDFDELIELIRLMPYSYSSITSKTQTKIDNTEYNQTFIKQLQDIGIIGQIKPIGNKIRLWMKKFD